MNEAGESPQIPPPSLQFETAEGLTPDSPACAMCRAPLATEYHELNGHPVCASCRAKEEAAHAQDMQWSRFITAAVYGFGAALAGGLLYWGFVKLTNIEFGLMAIAVGWLVGKAVMKGSNMRGGRRYQILALALTYFSITLSYGVLMIEEISKRPTPVAIGLGFILLLMLAAPFLGGFSNIIGLFIIGIGLFEAWKQTRLVPFSSGGPYRFGSGPPAKPPSPAGAA